MHIDINMKTAGSSLAQLFFVSIGRSVTAGMTGGDTTRTFVEVDIPVPAKVTQYEEC